MSIAAEYLSSITAAAVDADRVDAGNGIGVAIVTTMSRVQLLHEFRISWFGIIRDERTEDVADPKMYRSRIRSRGPFLDFTDH